MPPALATKDIADYSLRQSLSTALADDDRLSHEEVVDLIRSTLDGSAITTEERNDLELIANRSRSMSARSRKLIRMLVEQFRATEGTSGSRMVLSFEAGNLVCDFLKRHGNAKFKNLDRDRVGIELLMRLAKPSLIDQGKASLCGPSTLLFMVARDKPVEYARFAINLFEKGEGRLGKLKIKPSSDCRAYLPPEGSIAQVDWLTAASIRDSENWLFDYDSVNDEFSGITLPGELASWFKNAGYTDVRNKTNLVFTKSTSNINEVNQLFNRGYRVCLFIGVNMLYTNKQSSGSTTAEHWVGLRSEIKDNGGNISFQIYTWGQGDRKVPENGTLSRDHFGKNFYGYVAAKP